MNGLQPTLAFHTSGTNTPCDAVAVAVAVVAVVAVAVVAVAAAAAVVAAAAVAAGVLAAAGISGFYGAIKSSCWLLLVP